MCEDDTRERERERERELQRERRKERKIERERDKADQRARKNRKCSCPRKKIKTAAEELSITVLIPKTVGSVREVELGG